MKLHLLALLLFIPLLTNAQAAPATKDSQGASGQEAKRASRIRVGGNVEAAQIAHTVQPVYPDLARQAHIQGDVVLHAIIETDGSVEDLTVVSGHPLLIQSALDTVRQWRYKQTLLNSEPVEVDTTITVQFNLDPAHPVRNQSEMEVIPSVGSETAKDIRHLMEASGVRGMMPQFSASIFQQLKPSIVDKLPPGPNQEKIGSRLIDLIQQAVSSDGFAEALIPVYAKHFTREEIKDMTAFYESPVGRHYVQEAPAILTDSQSAASTYYRNVVFPGLVRQLVKEFPELGQPSPPQKSPED